MKRLIACGLVLLFASALKAESIPLDQIWGYHLPGTRDIDGMPLPEADPQQNVAGRTYEQFKKRREFYIEEIRQALAIKSPTERALPGFVLPRRSDFFTLQRASTLLSGMLRYGRQKGEIETDTLRADEELTLVFFTHPASYYVRLREVRRNGEEIVVRYQFEPHATVESTVHFALIPLGKLPAGKYRVRYEQIPMDKKYRDAGFEPVWQEAPDFVSRSFSFEVWEPTVPEPLQDATHIPLDEIWAWKMPGTKNIGKLDADKTETGTIYQILVALSDRPKHGHKAGPAFVVEGTGEEALEKAATVLTGKEPVTKSVTAETDLSLVFYSYSCGQYVHIVSIEQSKKQIRVRYQFVGHATTNMTKHIALIPLGKLPEGKVEVTIEQTASIDQSGKEQPPFRDMERLVCDSFTFEVQK